ncbi:hypothetical protein [Kitasatospora azatica]|uniref:hypothetical protein n=1 Tax=Kitasatospora azatica TaxID=58347 RepID=UPI00056242C5|nr:hypothetical protein [Kitasatospora azatica]
MSSRESDSANPSSRRGSNGPDAYPSGTPPYGIPGLGNGFGPGDQFGAPHEEAEPEVPKTETTLTTRISINIPGSRPIPPVVVRSSVKPDERSGPGEPEPETPAAPAGPRHRSAPSASPVLGVMDQGGRPATPPDLPPEWQTPTAGPGASEAESTGEWFRPRQKGRPEPVGSPAAPTTRAPRPTGAAAQAPAPAPAPTGPATGSPYQQSGPRPGQGGERGGEQPAAPRFSAQTSQQTPLPRPTGAPASPFGAPQGGGYPADPYAAGNGAQPGRPYPAQNNAGPQPAQGGQAQGGQAQGGQAQGGQAQGGQAQGGQAQGGQPQNGQAQNGQAQGGQAQHNSGPYPAGSADPFGTGGPADPFGSAGGQGAGPGAARPTGTPGAPGRFARNQPPVSPYPAGPPQAQPLPADGESTQIGGFDPITGELPAEAIPGLPVAGQYGAAPAAPRGATATAPQPVAAAGELRGEPAPAPQSTPKAAQPAAPKAAGKPKGRSKAKKLLVTGTGGVLFLGAAVYGTGLMLNQSDVPRGTTVLGTDIGGDSRDQAVHQLDSTVGKIGQQPIQLKIGDQALTLDPATAGLSFDPTATVDGLTKHSYNPSDVLSSLTGGSKAVPPVVHIDRAKLKVALDGLAASSAHGLKEGFVQFGDSGDPTVVPGQAGQVVDGGAAVDQVAQSYQDRAAGKADQPITLAVTAAQPKISTQALQQAADGLGKAIASGSVTVQAGTKKFVFTKAMTGKTLTLVPDAATGAIGPKWDLDQLGNLVGTTFDKLKFRKSDGSLAPITTQDVADAIASVYDKSSVAERTFKFRL